MTVYIVWGWYTTAIGDLRKEILDIYSTKKHAHQRLYQAIDHARMLSLTHQYTIEEVAVKTEAPY